MTRVAKHQCELVHPNSNTIVRVKINSDKRRGSSCYSVVQANFDSHFTSVHNITLTLQ